MKLGQTQNTTLIPKWKQRSHDTHLKHLKLYSNKHFSVAFLGDSMMERWLGTGISFWDKFFDGYANLGVGGDRIENLLYRLTSNQEFKGILDVITVDKIILMIGTNNLEKTKVNDILEGIVYIINLIFQKQPNVEIVVYGLTARTDIVLTKINELNTKLHTYIKDENNSKLKYRDFGDKINNEDKFFVDNVHLSFDGYSAWFDDLKKVLGFK